MFCFSCHGHWSHSVGQELSDKPEGAVLPIMTYGKAPTERGTFCRFQVY